jgi:hypothetical protein
MTVRRKVKKWPSFLLRDIPTEHRQLLTADAAADNISISDIIRRILCARYRLHCPPESYRYDSAKDIGAETVLLRLQPALWHALEREHERTGRAKRRIILLALEAHYEQEAA